MIFTVYLKTRTGRIHKLNFIAPNFEECLKKISDMYGVSLVKIEYDLRKNSMEGGDHIAVP